MYYAGKEIGLKMKVQLANTVSVNENIPCDQHWGKSVEKIKIF
jgi:hypothetical protein